ncbi:MAG TPA: histidine triad nucleotide-binding protein [Anaeromyxobacteraceae bacterium]|nr:histidine triad nucleotide-binding protein [Anaeromyxobacteraceae bacterium]
MSDCLFCGIAAGTVPATLVHQDAEVVAFEDIHPQAPVHVLVAPRRHIVSLNDLGPGDEALAGKLLRVAASVARARGVAEPGWRAVVNSNREGGQIVFHLHLHVLGGRPMFWPPG